MEIDVAAAEMDVTKSKPLIDNSAVTMKKIKMYKYINAITDDINLSFIFFTLLSWRLNRDRISSLGVTYTYWLTNSDTSKL